MRYVCAYLFLCVMAFAQDVPRAELFVGYSYINADTNSLTSRLNMNGADVSFVANINQWAGAETNFSTYFKRLSLDGVGVSLHDYNVIFGPRLHYKWAFAHVLAGLDDFGGSALGSSTTNGAFGGAFGGGAIFKITNRIGVEGGADYLVTRHNLLGGSAVTQNHYRALAGVVFTFGSAGASAEQSPQPVPTRAPRPVPAPRATSSEMKIDALGIMAMVGRIDGAEITDIAPNGAVALAGLHRGDVINSVDGKPVKTPMDLAAELSSHAVGDKVRLGYSLHGQWQAETVVILGGR
ncbi:MAG: PDZ domain-containing protein [Candidatus Sulfotelmatobacter sp.]|jgi:hypothetical protein